MLHIFAMKAAGMDFSGHEWDEYLSAGRRGQAERYRSGRKRELFLGAEVLLNRSLKAVCKELPLPAALVRNQHGKPYLKDADGIYANWSHSGEYVLCAVADCEVGVDLQYNRKEPKENLVRKILNPSEMEIYQAVGAERQRECFYNFWTLKESFLKALGTGFYTPLEKFCIHMGGDGPQIVQDVNEKEYGCSLLEFSDRDYTAAVCCEGNLRRTKIIYL